MQKQKVTIYADGSSLGNPGPGGYGTLIDVDGKETPLHGGDTHTTNNRMELLGVIEGLRWVKKNLPEVKICTVVSDSKLVIETLNSGWKRKKNLDLWADLDKLLPSFTKITWQWVKGHNGHRQNTIVDKLATTEALRQKRLPVKHRPSTAELDDLDEDNEKQAQLF